MLKIRSLLVAIFLIAPLWNVSAGPLIDAMKEYYLPEGDNQSLLRRVIKNKLDEYTQEAITIAGVHEAILQHYETKREMPITQIIMVKGEDGHPDFGNAKAQYLGIDGISNFLIPHFSAAIHEVIGVARSQSPVFEYIIPIEALMGGKEDSTPPLQLIYEHYLAIITDLKKLLVLYVTEEDIMSQKIQGNPSDYAERKQRLDTGLGKFVGLLDQKIAYLNQALKVIKMNEILPEMRGDAYLTKFFDGWKAMTHLASTLPLFASYFAPETEGIKLYVNLSIFE
jgi:hypothetical protein